MLITNIRLFDGTSDNLIEDSSIWIEDNLIRYAGPSKNLKEIQIMFKLLMVMVVCQHTLQIVHILKLKLIV